MMERGTVNLRKMISNEEMFNPSFVLHATTPPKDFFFRWMLVRESAQIGLDSIAKVRIRTVDQKPADVSLNVAYELRMFSQNCIGLRSTDRLQLGS